MSWSDCSWLSGMNYPSPFKGKVSLPGWLHPDTQAVSSSRNRERDLRILSVPHKPSCAVPESILITFPSSVLIPTLFSFTGSIQGSVLGPRPLLIHPCWYPHSSPWLLLDRETAVSQLGIHRFTVQPKRYCAPSVQALEILLKRSFWLAQWCATFVWKNPQRQIFW